METIPKKIKEKKSRSDFYFATFDLTAFYDSIDHLVLSYFLNELGIDNDDIILLELCLKKWASSTWMETTNGIELRQGIPQGPNASGIFSEVVLQHLDKVANISKQLTYLRYVDDIFIASKSKTLVQNALTALDTASKEVGLYPQNSKITSIFSSNENKKFKPIAPSKQFWDYSSFRPESDNVSAIKKIIKAGISDTRNSSKLKKLILNTKPTHKLNYSIIYLLNNHPHFSPIIAQYFYAYKKIPKSLAQSILEYVRSENPFQNSVAEVIESSFDNIGKTCANEIADFVFETLKNDKWSVSTITPNLKVTLVKIALRTGRLGYQDFKDIFSNSNDWWTISELLCGWDDSLFGRPTVQQELNHCLKSNFSLVALAAAEKCIENDFDLEPNDIEESAVILLKELGLLGRHYQKHSRISELFKQFLKSEIPDFKWRSFLKNHKKAEFQLVKLNGDCRTDPDRFILGLDSWFDECFRTIWEHFKPTKTRPSYGHALKDKTISAALPFTVEALQELHTLRCRSFTAHPRDNTGRATKRLRYKDFNAVRLKLVKALDETIRYFEQI